MSNRVDLGVAIDATAAISCMARIWRFPLANRSKPRNIEAMNKIFRTSHLTPYDADYARWCAEQGALLREGPLSALDRENLAEEVESLAKRDRRTIESKLKNLLLHLLKWRFQPEMATPNWTSTLDEERYRIGRIIEDSPSLRSYPAEVLSKEYELAIAGAAAETGLPRSTFPIVCPFTIEQILDPSWLPNAG